MSGVTKARSALRALAMATLLPVVMAVTLPLAASDEADGYRLLELDGHKVKWGDRSLGVGARVSYAFAEETMRFDGAVNCGELAPMNALSNPDLPFEVLERETAAAFGAWERAADLSFHRVEDARGADIVLGAQGRPFRRAFANVDYAPGAHEGVRLIDQALVCLNPRQPWKVGFDGDKDVYDLRFTLIHEIGHAIGLDHPGPEGQIMGFRYTEAFADLQPGDRRGVRQLYGAAARADEPRELAGAAGGQLTAAGFGTDTRRSDPEGSPAGLELPRTLSLD